MQKVVGSSPIIRFQKAPLRRVFDSRKYARPVRRGPPSPQNPDGMADPSGPVEIVAGTGGVSHYASGSPIANSEVRNSTTYGVVKLTLHASSYDFQFVPVPGGTFTDSGSGICH
jgi:hypothetical protein